MELQGRAPKTAGLSVWFGTVAIFGGALLTAAGLLRCRRSRSRLVSGTSEPAGFPADFAGVLVASLGVAPAAHRAPIDLRL